MGDWARPGSGGITDLQASPGSIGALLRGPVEACGMLKSRKDGPPRGVRPFIALSDCPSEGYIFTR